MSELLLNVLHDKAFDRGLISITTNYRIIVSSLIKNTMEGNSVEDWLLSFAGKEIRLANKFMPEKCFLEYHNDVVFKK